MTAKRDDGDGIRAHFNWLADKVANWRLPSGVDSEDIVAESISALWQADKIDSGTPQQQRGWLLRVACNKKHEQIRFANRCRAVDFTRPHLEPAMTRYGDCELETSIDRALENSTFWKRLSVEKRHVVVQCVMLDRTAADVARELELKRQTVASWAKRIPKRLASDPAFMNLSKQLEVNDG